MVSRKRITEVKRECQSTGFRTRLDPERTYCYCHALGLTYPHYIAEHTQDHDDARELFARRAEGGKW